MCPVCGLLMPIIRSSRVLYRWLLPVVLGASRAPDDGHSGAQKHVEQAIRSAIKIICCI
jgi:hypothetical protein